MEEVLPRTFKEQIQIEKWLQVLLKAAMTGK